jgi:DNA-binding MarR family transcriptional regulator
MKLDRVDTILEEWKRERPDVDASGMAIIGRISRLDRMIAPHLKRIFARHELEPWDFDVLATLRRAGAPYRLTAGQLVSAMMITSGAVTNRLDRLERRSLIRRSAEPNDGRVVLVELTNAGLERIDRALPDHVANEARIIAGLTARDRATLARLLRQLHNAVEGLGIP